MTQKSFQLDKHNEFSSEVRKRNFLKQLLGLNGNDLNISRLDEIIQNQALNDLLHLETLIKTVDNLPMAFKEQNRKIIENISNPKKFQKAYTELRNFFENDTSLCHIKNFFDYMLNLEDVSAKRNCNKFIFAFAGKEIFQNELQLSTQNIYLNFFIVQDWIERTKKIPLTPLNEFETALLTQILYGFQANEINLKNITPQEIEDYQNRIFPEKFGVNKFIEVLGKVFYSVPAYISYANEEIIYRHLKKLFYP